MKPSVFKPQKQILKKTNTSAGGTTTPQSHISPISPAKQPFRAETRHFKQATRRLCLPTYPEQFPPPPTVSEWLRSDRKWATLWAFFCLVSDPLQRDAHQVHLPATQRLLAAHHASEQRGRSLQLPRYGHEVTNYHTHPRLLPFLHLPVAASKRQVEKQRGRGRGKTTPIHVNVFIWMYWNCILVSCIQYYIHSHKYRT